MGLFGKLTGKDRAESWKILSEEMGAEFMDRGMLKGGPKIVLPYKNWNIEMDMYTETRQGNDGPNRAMEGAVVLGGNHNSSITYTRIFVPFVKGSDFNLSVYKEGGLSKMMKVFGGQDIEIGIPDFDKDYRVKSNDEEKTKRLFQQEEFSRLLRANVAQGLFEIQDNKGLFTRKENVTMSHVLYRQVGEITDHERVKNLFHLLGVTLDLLVTEGKAKDMTVSEFAYSRDE